MAAPKERCTLTIWDLENRSSQIQVAKGTNLRRALLDHTISPYTAITRNLNCGGRGLCATCGVWIRSEEVKPAHWHDKLANRFRYPRLSCQITVEKDMEIALVEKWIWGQCHKKTAKRNA